MTDSAPTISSGAKRPLGMRVRADLVANRQCYEGRDCWVVKDPIAMKYFRFEEEEYRLLQMIDGEASPDQIKRKFEHDFSPQKINLQELFQLVGMLYRNSLLVSDAPEQGESLRHRAAETEKAKRWQSLTNILAIRFKGFDPDEFLTAINPYTAWFFTWPAFFGVLLLGFGALSLIVTNFESFQNKLPSFDNFFAASNWLLLAIVLGVTKVIHEFGHGLACKRFGGRCHEMGLMFLVLTPCLYANVSDSWVLKSKWQRAFIAAAGMYVELVIASIAVFVWWFSMPGLVHHLALNVIVVCSVSTLLFNANPLLRYDGYYILADVLEIPNLRQKSSAMLNRVSGKLFLGIESAEDPFAPSRRKWLFITYSILAVAYRWLITFSIFWFVYRVLEPYGLKIIGQMLAVMAIYGLVGMPLVKLYKFFSIPGRTSMVKLARLAGTLVAVGLVLGGIMLIPIPRYVYGSFYIEPQNVQTVYVEEPGVLSRIYVQPNQHVEAGTPLVELESPDLKQQLAGLESAVHMANVELWVAEQAEMNRMAGQMSPVEANAAVETALANYRKKHADGEKLRVRSPRAGFFLAGHRRPVPNSDSGVLDGWHGSPLEPRNIGCSMDRQTIVGRIVPDMKKLIAVLAIDQSEIEFIRSDQSVKLVSWQDRSTAIHSQTEKISPVEMKVVPQGLSSRYGGGLVTRQNANGEDEPLSTTYMVNVPVELAEDDAVVFPGSTGVARIRTGSQTVGTRIWRLVCQTFQFEL
ncbi:site-2 protease family protein [Mariniblastus fucicola]|uniref:Peptide zinc metalloprotease protein YydH n=1 Tax=Mariniblastus fucicola TaxID=980251 RepID=A0A5B9P7X5_9BACT|nr:site-2 protease family protein [Mariniblastus fucicola]QEG21315.1 Putative peptide zinc metalloprotease protein YydH [Mariniblastus fucicola]